MTGKARGAPASFGDLSVPFLQRPFTAAEVEGANPDASDEELASALSKLPKDPVLQRLLVWRRSAGRALRDARVEAGKRQKDAPDFGVSVPWVIKFEEGSNWGDLETVMKALDALHLSPDDVFWAASPMQGPIRRAPKKQPGS